MIHNFNQFLENRYLLESKILENEGVYSFPETFTEVSAQDIEDPPQSKSEPASNNLGSKSDSSPTPPKESNTPGDNTKNVTEYIVKPGDTLSKIALSFGLKVGDWEKIYNFNKEAIGKNPNLIKPGLKLKIPLDPDSVGVVTSPKKAASPVKPKKKIQISDKTNSIYIDRIKSVENAIDSTKSSVLFGIKKDLGCATFVNDFTEALNVVGDAWLARDIINGTLIYDVFSNLTQDQIKSCINLWNSIYSRKERTIKNKKGVTKKVKWIEGQTEMANKIRNLIQSISAGKKLDPKKLKVGDICGIYYPPSGHQEEAFFEGGKNYFTDEKGKKGIGNVPGKTITGGQSWCMNTHLGIVGAIENGNPVVFHAIPKRNNSGVNIWADGINKIHGGGKIVWVERPKNLQNQINL